MTKDKYDYIRSFCYSHLHKKLLYLHEEATQYVAMHHFIAERKKKARSWNNILSDFLRLNGIGSKRRKETAISLIHTIPYDDYKEEYLKKRYYYTDFIRKL